MAYKDDETPEKRGGGPLTLALLGVVTGIVTMGSIGIVAYTGVKWQWLLLPSLLLVACLSLGIWLSMRRHKALHLDDEFHKMRFRWTRTYGLAAAMIIVFPVYLGARYLQYLPDDWGRAVTAIVPHPADFASGMMFVMWAILLCILVAEGIWRLRHK